MTLAWQHPPKRGREYHASAIRLIRGDNGAPTSKEQTVKVLSIAIGILLVLVLGVYVFREPLMAAVAERMTADMFVQADMDAYDPGVATGASFPAIRALYDGKEVTDVAQFIGPNGLVLVANRSVDW
jgi:hypothetical protein